MSEAWKKLIPYFEKQKTLGHIMSLLNYDIETVAPKKGIEEENDLIAGLYEQYSAIFEDPEFIALVKQAKEEGGLNERQALLIEDHFDEIDFASRVPSSTLAEWSRIVSKCTEVWRDVKAKGDYETLLPYFKKTVEVAQKEADARRKPHHKTRYDALLDEYEAGGSQQQLDAVFGPLKEFLIKNLPIVLEKQKASKLPPVLPHSRESQKQFALALLPLIGYDLDRGALGEVEHPFSDNIGKNDCRVTTHIYESDWRSSLFSVIHEGGHAIQFQNWPEESFIDFVNGRCSAALCETHSRFYENIIARDKAFTPHVLRLGREYLGGELNDMDEEGLYRLINEVKPDFIRCDADEFTYCLHIIIRYELERDLINGDLTCEELPQKWNAKYKEYLGIDVPNNSLGCMQDVHWYQGSFGYFPSYALGNLYGAQIKTKMGEDLDFEATLRSGDLTPILAWLRDKDFVVDYLDPNDWILRVTEEAMNPSYFISYLTKKYLD